MVLTFVGIWYYYCYSVILFVIVIVVIVVDCSWWWYSVIVLLFSEWMYWWWFDIVIIVVIVLIPVTSIDDDVILPFLILLLMVKVLLIVVVVTWLLLCCSLLLLLLLMYNNTLRRAGAATVRGDALRRSAHCISHCAYAAFWQIFVCDRLLRRGLRHCVRYAFGVAFRADHCLLCVATCLVTVVERWFRNAIITKRAMGRLAWRTVLTFSTSADGRRSAKLAGWTLPLPPALATVTAGLFAATFCWFQVAWYRNAAGFMVCMAFRNRH